MVVPQSALETIALSQARVTATMELTPKQLRLLADWLTAIGISIGANHLEPLTADEIETIC